MAYTQEIDRYPRDWSTRSRETKRSRQRGDKVQCSCCEKFYPWDNIEVHHASYEGENDRAGVNIFPVCGSKQEPGTCHHWLHLKKQWIKESDIWHNRNTPPVLHDLQDGYEGFNSHSETPPWLEVTRIPWAGIIGTAIGVVSFGWVLGSILLNPPTRIPLRKAIVAAPVNVRSGPGTKYVRVGQLKTGASVQVFEESVGWFRVGDRQWIAGNFTITKGSR